MGVVGEAGQTAEAHAAISLCSVVTCGGRVVFIGDPLQLPPAVKSMNAAALGMGISMFERLQMSSGENSEA
eukprot:1648328-Pyramimonas_sp.AAC.1